MGYYLARSQVFLVWAAVENWIFETERALDLNEGLVSHDLTQPNIFVLLELLFLNCLGLRVVVSRLARVARNIETVGEVALPVAHVEVSKHVARHTLKRGSFISILAVILTVVSPYPLLSRGLLLKCLGHLSLVLVLHGLDHVEVLEELLVFD